MDNAEELIGKKESITTTLPALADEFLNVYFSATPTGLPNVAEEPLIRSIVERVKSDFDKKKYLLQLTVDFACLAQMLSGADVAAKAARPSLTEAELFAKYKRVEKRSDVQANTLSVLYEGRQYGIRQVEEQVVSMLHGLNRKASGAYVYNTGQWHKNIDLLVDCFRLSEISRLALCRKLISLALEKLPENTFFGRSINRPRLFEGVLNEFPRSAIGENGGLIMQAIGYAYTSADRPHLDILADKVRTGSRRQKRFGDIDAYHGADLEFSMEVKDYELTKKLLEKEMMGFVHQASLNSAVNVSFSVTIDDEAKTLLNDSSILALTLDNLKEIVSFWDYTKQDNALSAMVHYLAHIEQDASAVKRLLSFVKARSPLHDLVSHLAPDAPELDGASEQQSSPDTMTASPTDLEQTSNSVSTNGNL